MAISRHPGGPIEVPRDSCQTSCDIMQKPVSPDRQIDEHIVNDLINALDVYLGPQWGRGPQRGERRQLGFGWYLRMGQQYESEWMSTYFDIISLSVCLSACLCLSVSVCLSVCLPGSVSASQSVSLGRGVY